MPIPTGFDPSRLLKENIGGYQLHEVLGAGNALVYRAYDPRKGEHVALKLLSWPGAHLDETTLRRFKREIDLLRRRRHSAIVDIYDWHTAGDYVYMAMECCDGTLEGWLLQQRPDGPKLTDVLRIAEPLASALDFLHEGSPPVLHRDIKPANILFKGTNWYISDFGIARMEADQLTTLDGAMLGTLRYAAPEQMTAGKLTGATDVYSFGLVVYEMLAGGWALGPRQEGAAYEIPPISRIRRELGPRVDDLFARWLARDPAQRPRRAADAVRELAAAAGILRDPALARLYDLAADLAARPRNRESWTLASDILGTIALHEPAFSDPRGLDEEMRLRQIGDSSGPNPPGYTGAHPETFYSEATLLAPPPDLDGAGENGSRPTVQAEEAPARRLQPPADLSGATFAPRSRYDTDSTLHAPPESRVEGSIFGRTVVIDPGARVDGDVYSLGDLTVGANAEIAGAAVAGGALTTARGARIGGAGGAHAAALHLGRGARLTGWAMAGDSLTAEDGIEAAGLLAGGPLALEGGGRIASSSVGSARGDVAVTEPVLLAGAPAGPEHTHPWSGDAAGRQGHAVSSIFTRQGRAVASAALGGVDTPAVLTTPRPVDLAIESELPAAPATDGPTLYLPAALRLDPEAPPALPAPAEGPEWEGALAGAWLLGEVWRDFRARLRVPALCAGAFTILAWALAVWLALAGQGAAAGLTLLAWLVVGAVALGLLWLARPRPLELTRLWWAWETWTVEGGVLLWDTLDGGAPPGYPEPDSEPSRLAALAEAVVAADAADSEVLTRLGELNGALESGGWKSWPGVFAPRPSALDSAEEPAPDDTPASLELLQMPLEPPAPALLGDLLVLSPRLDPRQVRAGAERLAAWPAYQTEARAAWRRIEEQLKEIDPILDRWEAGAQAAAERGAAALQSLDLLRARLSALAEESLRLLEREIAPDLDRLWELHVAGTKLLGAYYERNRLETQTAALRDQERARMRADTAGRELRRHESALTEIEAELRPLAARWQDLTTAHERLGAELRRLWKAARATAGRNEPEPEIFVTPRPAHADQAATHVPHLTQEAMRLAAQADDLFKLCAKEDRDLPADLPWPAWPPRIETPIAVDDEVAALTGLLRQARNEPIRARGRLDALSSLRARATLALERALGVQEALAAALAAAPLGTDGTAGRMVSLKTQVDAVVGQLSPLIREMARQQRKLELTTVSYDEVADTLQQALKGGRTPPTWEQARRLQAEQARLQGEHDGASKAAEATRVALAAAQDEHERVAGATAATLERSQQAEKALVAASQEHAGREEVTLRRHIEQLRARHAAVLESVGAREEWMRALAAFEDGAADMKVRATAHLVDRIRTLAALAAGRIDATAEARAAALWPEESWPAADMLYLLPVWLLRYRPLGRRATPRLLAVTPGVVREAAPRGRLAAAGGFTVAPQPGLRDRFAADVLAWANRGPGLSAPLAGQNLLNNRGALAARWREFGGAVVAPWLARFL